MTNTTTNPAGETPAHPRTAHLLRHDFLRSYAETAEGVEYSRKRGYFALP